MKEYTKIPNAMTEKFTPLFDDITAKYGVVTSAVYGYIWRKCQLDRGVCDASFQTMADDLSISRRTVITHVKMLVNNGIIEDLTPDADRKPHKYLAQNLQQAREANSLDGLAPSEIDSPALGQEIHQTRETDSPKETIKESIKDNIKDGDSNVSIGAVYTLYQDNIGGLNKIMSDDIAGAYQDYGGQWMLDAIAEAVRNGVYKWSYIQAILKNWQTNGRQAGRKNGSQSTVKQANDAAGGVYV